MKEIEFSGKVFSGQSKGKNFLELPWVKKQIEEKFGFTPYLGTLNIKLSEKSTERRKLLEKIKSMKVCPTNGYCSGIIFTALIGDLECAVVIPEVADYPKDILEVIAPINLRKKFQLKDGDDITVTITV